MSEADTRPDTFLDRWTRLSLARRIILAAAVWGLIVLIGGAVALSALYRAQTLSLLSDDLDQTLITLTRDMTREGAFLPDGRVTDDNHVFLSTDSRYQTQYSGRYWAIVAVNDEGDAVGDLRSRSLWDEPVPMSPRLLKRALATPGTTQFGIGPGPAGQRIFAAAKAILVENRETPLVLVAAADRAQNDAAATRFRNLLIGTMVVLFGSVFAAMVAGIRYSLRPLVKLGHDIAEIREGTRLKLPDDYPSEVQPLTEELNKLVDHNREVVERARTHVGNLAHALKTPIAVLRNEATGGTQLDDVVRRQVDSMQTNVEHYLKRARMAARAEALGARTEVRPVLDGIARLMNRLYDAKGIDVSVFGGEAAVFRGEQQDLEEMVGNLMENACKWAKADVRVQVEDDPEELRIEVDDDGPGLTAEEREGALKRGVRLDETTPGTGLGLSIVTELAELHKGVLELDEAPAGGLRARLRFPKR
ncbi:ATP-binding protein [Hyphomonas sp.]|uniref:ATP-binding protein n=1 Tax=Hyphomonas sp. TaxID=87 RepID=UPI003529835F